APSFSQFALTHCWHVNRLRTPELCVDLQVPVAALPEPRSAEKRVVVTTWTRALGKRFQAFDVATTQYYIVDLEHLAKPLNNICNCLAPLFRARSSPPPFTYVVFVGTAMFVGHVSQLHRLDDAIENQSCTEAGAQPEKQHPAALVAADGLHGSI